MFDANGYFPDGGSWSGVVEGQDRVYDDFAAVMAAGEVEGDGVLLGEPIFASGVLGPTDEMAAATPVDLALADGSNAIDAGHLFPGIDDGFVGAEPDLGAREQGCDAPSFGPRPAAQEAVVAPVNCSAAMPGGSDSGDSDGGGVDETGSGNESEGTGSATGSGSAGGTGSGTGGANEDGGGGCGCASEPRGSASVLLLLLAVLRRRDRAVMRSGGAARAARR